MGLEKDMKEQGFLGEYFSLKKVLKQAVDQAECGKGKERHAEANEPFERQIICEVARRVGLGYPLGQAVKKIYESQRLGGTKGLDELLGAINYIAAAYIVMQERVKAETAKEAAEFSAALDKTADEMNAKVLEGVMKHAEGCEEPEFKPGDRVQFRDEIPSTSEPYWFDGTYIERLPDGGHAVSFGPNGHVIHCSDKEIRHAPKAEGCEELVQKDLHEDCEGCLYKTYADSHAEEHDAPQTKEELFERIKSANPAIYGAHIE